MQNFYYGYLSSAVPLLEKKKSFLSDLMVLDHSLWDHLAIINLENSNCIFKFHWKFESSVESLFSTEFCVKWFLAIFSCNTKV